MDSVIEFLNRLLENILKTFRSGNPVLFAVVEVILIGAYFISGYLLDTTLESGVFLIADEAIRAALNTAQDIIVVIAGIVGYNLPNAGKDEESKAVEEAKS